MQEWGVAGLRLPWELGVQVGQVRGTLITSRGWGEAPQGKL